MPQVPDDASKADTAETTTIKTKNVPDDIRDDVSSEGEPPPLPPRPSALSVLQHSTPKSSSSPKSTIRPGLVSSPTTKVSLAGLQTASHSSARGKSHPSSIRSGSSPRSHTGSGPPSRSVSRHGCDRDDYDDTASVTSYAPTLTGGAAENLLGDVLGAGQMSPAWNLQNDEGIDDLLDLLPVDSEEPTADFGGEFDELAEIDRDGSNEEELLIQWRSKRKHFLILSAAGKPIYNRHGSDNLISGYIGVVQTIISFYESSHDELRTFTAGDSRFVIMTQGPLYLVAISKLGESDMQLRNQLDALYMQILSTLTLPTLSGLFSKRPSTDLRQPLQGTESLLSALADSFTRGSPSTLLSSLECLKIRNTHRQAIDSVLIKTRCKDLLYGLIVAGGSLVSVIRPRTHSLHPGDLQLIFNMLFEAEGVNAGGGESWIPMCLPGFNKNGFLYMYVSFIDARSGSENDKEDGDRGIDLDDVKKENRIAVLLISAKKESFYKLRSMRDATVAELEKNGKMRIIKAAVLKGRPQVTDIFPGTVLKHFLYKSRRNLQFAMPSYEPHFATLLDRRRLMSQYDSLHASVHSKNKHLKVHHCVSRDFVSLAWVTNTFELYCVAGSNVQKQALLQSVNKVIQWVRKEEERIFIIGGAVF